MLRKPLISSSVRVSGLYARHSSTTVAVEDVESSELLNAKPYEDTPKILSLPIIGSSWSIMPIIGKYDFRKFHIANKMKYEEYGKILREDLSSYNKILHVFDPADFERVYRNEGRLPERRPFLSFMKAVQADPNYPSLGLLSTNGEEWWSLRSKIQPHMMKPRTTANYLPAVDGVASEFIERMKVLRNKQSLEINDFESELRRYALECVGLVALDAKLGCLSLTIPLDDEKKVILKSATEIFDMMYTLEFKSPFWRLWETPLFKEFKSTIHAFNRIAQKYLNQARLRLEKDTREDRELTILEHLIMSDVDPKDISITINDLFLAGVDTTYITSGFFFYHMARNPKVQEKVRQEINQLLPEKNSPITLAVLNECRFLKACVKESMRVTPTALGGVRKLTKDTVLAGYRVPAETQVFMQMMVAGHDEKNFPEPLKFKPERWLRGTQESRDINPYAHLPFGFGPRSCVGRRIAEQEMWSLVIRVLQNFKIEYHHEDIGIYSRLANYPDKPLRFEFHDLK